MRNPWVLSLVVLLLVPLVLSQLAAAQDVAGQDCAQLRTLVYPPPKEYEISKAYVNMTVLPDGQVRVEQTMHFNFYRGKFSFAYADIGADSSQVSDISVTEDGRPVCFDYLQEYSTGVQRVKWYYDEPENRARTFTVAYTLHNIMASHDDYTDLYWKVWGETWAVPVRDLEGSINLPGDVAPSEVYTWGHPRFAQSRIGMSGNRSVVFQVFDVPPEQWVEMRVAFPTRLLTSREYTTVETGPGLSAIERSEAFQPYRPVVLYALFPLLVVILFLILYLRYGREPEVRYQGIYEREIPYDYSPATVSALFNQDTKQPSNEAFAAVLLDLVQRKYITLEKTKRKRLLFFDADDYVLTLTARGERFDSDVKLLEFEKKVLEILFAGKTQASFSEFQSRARGMSAASFRLSFNDWKQSVKKDIESRDLLGRNEAQVAFWIIVIGFLLFGILAIIFGRGGTIGMLGIGAFGAFFIGLIMAAVFRQALPRRTPAGALHYKRWKALKHFLGDFSELKRMPAESVVLWEKYLVYAIVLGEAKTVEKALQFKIDNGEFRRAHLFGTNFTSAAAMSGFVSSVNTFSSSVNSSVSTSGGGSFGGGGGSGGGSGGGGGAG